MLPEQQQRILGYFIEEARDHLNTIEQGLLNLQSTLNDPEMVNEVFRAAHSIKGGAAMLGLSSIQHTSHRLEDCFKVLKENPIQVDQKLESLFLGVSDTLKALLENLSGPFGLSEEAANTLMSETEPVFQWLNEHLELLVQQGNSGVENGIAATEIHLASVDNANTLTEIFFQRDFSSLEEEKHIAASEPSSPTVAKQTHSPIPAQENKNWGEFQTQVLQTLREMLQLFKQNTTTETRQNLQQCCHQLVKLGEAFNVPNWCNLCQAAANAIANPENSYLTLAKIVITEIKQAQELVLQSREAEITISQQLEVLLSLPEVEVLEITSNLVDELAAEPSLFASTDTIGANHVESTTTKDSVDFVSESKNSITNSSELSQQLNQDEGIPATTENINIDISELFQSLSSHEDDAPVISNNIDSKGPEVGIAELNTLADLFEGETPELDETWQQEEILDITAANKLGVDFSSSETEDVDSDLADLLSFDEDPSSGEHQTTIATTEDLSLLFGENFLEKENSKLQHPQTPTTLLGLSNISELDSLGDSNEEILKELTSVSHESQQSAVGSAPQDVVKDLLELAIDENELLSIGEVTQSKTNILTSIEASTNQESSFDDLFLETANANLVEEIVPSNYIEESKLTLLQPENLSFDNLFTELEENAPLAKTKPDIGDLFDTSSTTATEFSQSTDDLSNFWNEEAEAEQQPDFDPVLEQDVAKALEESLFTAANDFFGDTQPPTTSPTSFGLEDFDITFSQQEQQLDLILTSDAGDDLFAQLTLTNTTISANIVQSEVPLIDIGNISPEQDGDTPLSSTALPPEALDFIPEFTHQSTETTLNSSPKPFGELEMDLFDAIDENSNENPQFLFEDIATANLSDIQLTTTDRPVDDLLAIAPIDPDVTEPVSLQQSPTNPEVLDIKVENTLETEVDATAEITELDLVDDLLAIAPIDPDVTEPVSLQQSPTNPEVLDIKVDNTLEVEVDATAEITELDFADDLLAIAPIDPDVTEPVSLQQSPTNPEVLDIKVDNTLEVEVDATAEITELDFADDLLAIAPIDPDVTEPVSLQQSPTNPEVLDIKVENTLETEVDATAEITELDFADDLLAIATDLPVESPTNSDFTNFAIEENLVGLDVLDTTQSWLGPTLEIAQTVESATIEQENAAENNTELNIASATTLENEVALEDNSDVEDEFAGLEALLEEELTSSIPDEDFAALEALLGENEDQQVSTAPPAYPEQITPAAIQDRNTPATSLAVNDEFGDLEKLLAQADQTISHSPSIKPSTGKMPRSSTRRAARFEETMKVPVKQLDDMSNLVGELVVNRNTLEQDQERLRQSLDNLLIQVQHLSDVGARMQELYERSLLEASLLASRKSRGSDLPVQDFNEDRGFSELEMDRFTPFHTLSQEMIEMIVRVRESASDIDFVTEETERVARQFRQVTTQLQEGLTRARMVPFSQTIDRLRRGVRDNAIKYGKQVELVIEGGDTLIDKMILDHLTDPLTHMLNNAIAHGIETPEVRQAAAKNPVGVIKIRAFHQGNQTVISVGDDGAGIDTERIKAKALKLGMLTAQEAKTITRLEIYDLLFQSGFSIKDQADEISGRGVGMDVVRSEISEIRGTVNTDSTLGKGTTFTIRLPLTLSICKALCCVSDKARIAFPMDGIEDTLDIPVKNIQHNADGQTFIPWRDTVLPFRPLKELLAFNRQLSRGSVYGGTRDDDMVSVIVVRSANNLIALQIDLVLSEQEIVIKQFEGPAPKPLGVAGATVLGDGRIMPIADVLEIMDIFQGRISKQNGGSLWQQKATSTMPEITTVKIDPTVLIVDDSITVRELLSLTFNKAGYRVEQARDGQEAWDKLRSGLPCDIVFCDIEMPRCDGLELLSRIQKDSNLNHLPIAMLTSRGADKHRQMAIQLGASGYFTKPYLEEALLEAAVRMLKGEKLIHSTTA
ncbi:MAG: response regulator [Mojavia pulchra JT2-VF2]|jgi:chemosensory pili system protein ChpA (sensor histidine kinase/response regulator)|uniref:histidine kinase n=1 Tax=Mojavia pulchra JT2-VF2 TaxID=287848 RepID=A0A951Q472_9NOST|nr:response regulator [Mojavia pulchra JT2-VF2]